MLLLCTCSHYWNLFVTVQGEKCSNPESCSQLCRLADDNTDQCYCATGYTVDTTDHRMCRGQGQPYMLYTRFNHGSNFNRGVYMYNFTYQDVERLWELNAGKFDYMLNIDTVFVLEAAKNLFR